VTGSNCVTLVDDVNAQAGVSMNWDRMGVSSDGGEGNGDWCETDACGTLCCKMTGHVGVAGSALMATQASKAQGNTCTECGSV